MKTARFAHNGRVHIGELREGDLWVGSRSFVPDEVMFLPPVEPRGCTAIGVALGYADHAEELGLDLPDTPILFHKMPHTFVGHGADVTRPDVEYMHYEGELVAVMGRPCSGVSEEDALSYVGGYTIGNEFTVRDFVTNYYRPPVKAKGFDTFGPLGPYLVSAADVDPTNLSIQTFVNGELRQDGHTGNLRHSVAALVSYISEFMTLAPGDMIWTGTPKGISHVHPGDLVRVVIDGLGELENRVV